MKQIILFLVLLFTLQCGKAQLCGTGRYENFVFSTVAVDTVVYSTPYSIKMDIYQPVGDTLSARPLIVLAHGGSFVPPTNRETDNTVVQLCTNFAQRGYVVASIDYRLDTAIITMTDSATAIKTVFRAYSDGKAAIRYFYKDRRTSNTYKIDTNNIFIGGNSAGAVLFMHVAYIDSLGECPPDIQTLMNNGGGFEGNSGNAGYSSNFKAAINLAGGLNVPAFIGPGSKPVFSAQGDQDHTIPYYCGYPESGAVPVTICGLGSLQPLITANTVGSVSLVFPGDGHVPWSSDVNKFTRVDTSLRDFLFNLVCSSTSSGTCTSGPTACTASGTVSGYGFENPDSVPCAVQGLAYNNSIQFTTYTSFNYLGSQTVDSIQFVNITNLPCGLCWSTCHANDLFRAGEYGCIDISGTTTDSIGQYKLALSLNVWLNGGASPVAVPAYLADQAGIKLWLRVKSSGACVAVDTSSSAVNRSNCLAIATGVTSPVNLPGELKVYSYYSGGVNMIHVSGYEPYTYSLRLFELLGREIMNISNTALNEMAAPGQLAKGIYLLEVESKGSVIRSKVLIR